MAFILLGETWSGRTGMVDDIFDQEYQRVFRVKTTLTDVYTATAEQVDSTAGLPLIWDRYNSTPGAMGHYALAQSIKSRRDENAPQLWEVTVTYSTRVSDNVRQNLNPLLRPPTYEIDGVEHKHAAEFDTKGKPLTNSASLPFDPAYENDESGVVVTVTRNEQAYPASKILLYQGAVNSQDWAGGFPGYWKCKNIKARDGYERATYFWNVTYVFEFRKRPWADQVVDGTSIVLKTKILDQGRAELVNGKVIVIKDTAGQPVSQNVCLDGYGLRIDKGPDRGTKLTVAGVAIADTTISVNDPYQFVAGKTATMTSPTDTEDILVKSVNLSAKTITVERARNGTAAANFAADRSITQKTGAVTKLTQAMTTVSTDVTVYDVMVFGPMTYKGGAVTKRANFYVRVDDEDMFVTEVDDGSRKLTLTRAQNGTTAASHDSGAEIKQCPTFLNFDLKNAQDFNALNL